MITTLFLIGSVWFWLISLVAVLAVIFSLDKENGWGASATLILYVAAIVLLSDAEVINWVREVSVWSILEVAAGYLVFGTIWGVVKWFLYTRKIAFECLETYKIARRQFLVGKGISATAETEVPDDLKEAWQQESAQNTTRYKYLDSVRAYDEDKATLVVRADGKISPPEARNHKTTILMWMSFWPFSALWTVIDDFVKRAFEHIYMLISKHLQEISDRAFAGIINLQDDDFLKAEASPEPEEETVEK